MSTVSANKQPAAHISGHADSAPTFVKGKNVFYWALQRWANASGSAPEENRIDAMKKIDDAWWYDYRPNHKLELNNLGLTSIPDCIVGIDNLHTLDLSGNDDLQYIPDLSKLVDKWGEPCLKELVISAEVWKRVKSTQTLPADCKVIEVSKNGERSVAYGTAKITNHESRTYPLVNYQTKNNAPTKSCLKKAQSSAVKKNVEFALEINETHHLSDDSSEGKGTSSTASPAQQSVIQSAPPQIEHQPALNASAASGHVAAVVDDPHQGTPVQQQEQQNTPAENKKVSFEEYVETTPSEKSLPQLPDKATQPPQQQNNVPITSLTQLSEEAQYDFRRIVQMQSENEHQEREPKTLFGFLKQKLSRKKKAFVQDDNNITWRIEETYKNRTAQQAINALLNKRYVSKELTEIFTKDHLNPVNESGQLVPAIVLELLNRSDAASRSPDRYEQLDLKAQDPRRKALSAALTSIPPAIQGFITIVDGKYRAYRWIDNEWRDLSGDSRAFRRGEFADLDERMVGIKDIVSNLGTVFVPAGAVSNAAMEVPEPIDGSAANQVKIEPVLQQSQTTTAASISNSPPAEANRPTTHLTPRRPSSINPLLQSNGVPAECHSPAAKVLPPASQVQPTAFQPPPPTNKEPLNASHVPFTQSKRKQLGLVPTQSNSLAGSSLPIPPKVHKTSAPTPPTKIYSEGFELQYEADSVEHPRKFIDDNGNEKKKHIGNPTRPSATVSWTDASKVATFVPQQEELLKGKRGVGLAFSPFIEDSRKNKNTIQTYIDELKEIKSPTVQHKNLEIPKGVRVGVMIQIPDGRIVVVEPNNHFRFGASFVLGDADIGGNVTSIDKERQLEIAAAKEAYEETGLRIKVDAHLNDFKIDGDNYRFFMASVDPDKDGNWGNPANMDWESQSVSFVPIAQLNNFITSINKNPHVNHKRKPIPGKSDDKVNSQLNVVGAYLEYRKDAIVPSTPYVPPPLRDKKASSPLTAISNAAQRRRSAPPIVPLQQNGGRQVVPGAQVWRLPGQPSLRPQPRVTTVPSIVQIKGTCIQADNTCYLTALLHILASNQRYVDLFDEGKHQIKGNDVYAINARDIQNRSGIKEAIRKLQEGEEVSEGESGNIAAFLAGKGFLSTADNNSKRQYDTSEVFSRLLGALQFAEDQQLGAISTLNGEESASEKMAVLTLALVEGENARGEKIFFKSLEDALKRYSSEQTTDLDAKKQTHFNSFPDLLPIDLERSYFTAEQDGIDEKTKKTKWKNRTSTAITAPITVPDVLTIPKECLADNLKGQTIRYELVQYANRNGATVGGGHWQSSTKFDDKWSMHDNGSNVSGSRYDKNQARLYIYKRIKGDEQSSLPAQASSNGQSSSRVINTPSSLSVPPQGAPSSTTPGTQNGQGPMRHILFNTLPQAGSVGSFNQTNKQNAVLNNPQSAKKGVAPTEEKKGAIPQPAVIESPAVVNQSEGDYEVALKLHTQLNDVQTVSSGVPPTEVTANPNHKVSASISGPSNPQDSENVNGAAINSTSAQQQVRAANLVKATQALGLIQDYMRSEEYMNAGASNLGRDALLDRPDIQRIDAISWGKRTPAQHAIYENFLATVQANLQLAKTEKLINDIVEVKPNNSGGKDPATDQNENNCLIVSLLQHATGDYGQSSHTEIARELRQWLMTQTALEANAENKVIRSQPLNSDSEATKALVREINKRYGVDIHPVFLGAEGILNLSDAHATANNVVIYQCGVHFEAVIARDQTQHDGDGDKTFEMGDMTEDQEIAKAHEIQRLYDLQNENRA